MPDGPDIPLSFCDAIVARSIDHAAAQTNSRALTWQLTQEKQIDD